MSWDQAMHAARLIRTLMLAEGVEDRHAAPWSRTLPEGWWVTSNRQPFSVSIPDADRPPGQPPSVTVPAMGIVICRDGCLVGAVDPFYRQERLFAFFLDVSSHRAEELFALLEAALPADYIRKPIG